MTRRVCRQKFSRTYERRSSHAADESKAVSDRVGDGNGRKRGASRCGAATVRRRGRQRAKRRVVGSSRTIEGKRRAM